MKKITRKKNLTSQRRASFFAINHADLGQPNIADLFANSPIDFNEMLDNLPIGVVVLSIDRKVMLMNQALEALTGFDRKEACGASCANVLRNNICLHACPALKITDTSGPTCTNGNLIDGERQSIPVRITSAPLKNIDGDIIGYLETIEDIRPLKRLDESSSRAYKFDDVIGRSKEMKKIFDILPTLAQSDASVLITGETGTGKDMVAEIVHNSSDRSKGPFVKINCGALPETLLESELFGHRKGAFTGAVENKPGRFRMAHNGTLFLTEIGDLPISLQAKLLTFLDDKEVFPLGSTKGFIADVRVIAATNLNLEKCAAEGSFRKDLLFRLNVLRIHLPPVRQRRGDIQLLLDHFLNVVSAKLGKKNMRFSKNALNILTAYPYPGNVRELQNIIEYSVHICRQRKISLRHLPSYLVTSSEHRADAREPSFSPDDACKPIDLETSPSITGQNWTQIEREMILQALRRTGGRKNRAAEALGWARSTLWRKMKQHGIM